MHYKLYQYELLDKDEKEIHPDKHFKIFDRSKGKDHFGGFAEYRGARDSILMHIRAYRSDFIGLIGRHSTEREITVYKEADDSAEQIFVDDDDYPHAAFICMPRIRMIACLDSARVRADSAMARLHNIIGHRQKLFFIFKPITQTFDLRKAVKRFRLTEVTFEITPVNPHTDDLGRKLDASRKTDHIRRLNGIAHAPRESPMRLEGGFLTAVQQLQQSGHAKVGFAGVTEDNVEVRVQRPSRPMRLSKSEEDSVIGEDVGVRINVKERYKYPFLEHHVHQMRSIAKKFLRASLEDSDE